MCLQYKHKEKHVEQITEGLMILILGTIDLKHTQQKHKIFNILHKSHWLAIWANLYNLHLYFFKIQWWIQLYCSKWKYS